MGDDLVAKEVEIDPRAGATTFRKTEDLTVETTRFLNVVNREGNVEGAYFFHRTLQAGSDTDITTCMQRLSLYV